ncbi:sterol O-acyltransferase 1-like, partial [Centruroides vittatus]
MNLSIIGIIYPCLRVWSSTRYPSKHIGCYDLLFGAFYILYQMMLFFIPALVVTLYNIPQISSSIIIFEQIRLMMKVHAFVRENVPHGINFKPHQDDIHKPYPEIRNLIYFLFVPTLVYRDNYPRLPRTSWKKVSIYFVQFVACIFTTFVPFCRFLVTTFSQVGFIQFTKADIILIQTKAVLVGSLCMFLLFYGMLHCWLNMFAEILRFADRQFYSDWWNSTSYAQFYRTWNSVIHDWLYTYVYRDTYLVTRNKLFALFTVFFVSAVVHEYILTSILHFFYPVLLFLFGIFG